ncbi:MAG: nitrite reductase small subunit NirD [Marmoricola sp.]
MSDPVWVAVCRLEDLDVERGVAVLVHGRGIAVFRTREREVRAVSNRDPFSRAGVLARGLVGTREGVMFVASPPQLQAFDLATGVCLDDPGVRISTYDARVADGMVAIGRRRPSC